MKSLEEEGLLPPGSSFGNFSSRKLSSSSRKSPKKGNPPGGEVLSIK